MPQDAKLVDASDIIAGTSVLTVERQDGTRILALLTSDQVVYLAARFAALADKLIQERPIA